MYKKPFKFFKIFGVMSLCILFILSGCGTDSSSSSSESSTAISGNAMLGPVSGATVTAYPILSTNGSLDTAHPLATTTTDSNGNYSLSVLNANIPPTPLGIELKGGSYKEEGTGQSVTLGSVSYVTLLSSMTAGTAMNAATGPLPNMAFKKFQDQMKSGVPSNTTMSQMATDLNYQISQAFGISDIVGVLPANPFGTIPNDATGQYTAIIVAISKAAKDAGTDSVAMAAAYAASYVKDGNFAGVATSSTVTNASGQSVTVTPPSMSSLATTMGQIGSGQTVLSGVTLPSGFTAPTFIPIPSTVAPTGYIPGTPQTTAPITSGTTTTASSVNCSVSSVVGSITINAGGVKQCTDYVGASFNAATLQSTCQSQGASCSFSVQACNTINTSGYVGGCYNQNGGMIIRYYSGFTAEQVKTICNALQPPCSSGT